MIELLIVIAIVAAAALYLFKTFFFSLIGKKGGGACQCSGCSCDECPEISIGNPERWDENE